jgi:pimeloyl-ACP methyl ester carboxylesterase
MMLQTGEMPPGREIEIAGIRTRYHDAGAGETLVFIYGGNFGSADSASSAYVWNLNLAPLASRFRVVAFDKLGQGYTDIPARDEDYTMDAVVKHAAAFIAALDLPPVHLIGHSRGGYAATRLALEQPRLVRSLTIINSGTLTPGVGTNDVVLQRPPFPSLTRDSARWVYRQYSFDPEIVTDDWMEVSFGVMSQPRYREAVRKMVDEQLGVTRFAPALRRDKRETLAWIAEGRLQRPTQVVWGADDKTALVERGVELFDLIAAHERRSSFHAINQAGHFVYREHPERFNALVTRFVDAVCAEEAGA